MYVWKLYYINFDDFMIAAEMFSYVRYSNILK